MYHVYTRKALKNGTIKKGYREFATRAAQMKYIVTAPMSIVITSYN